MLVVTICVVASHDLCSMRVRTTTSTHAAGAGAGCSHVHRVCDCVLLLRCHCHRSRARAHGIGCAIFYCSHCGLACLVVWLVDSMRHTRDLCVRSLRSFAIIIVARPWNVLGVREWCVCCMFVWCVCVRARACAMMQDIIVKVADVVVVVFVARGRCVEPGTAQCVNKSRVALVHTKKNTHTHIHSRARDIFLVGLIMRACDARARAHGALVKATWGYWPHHHHCCDGGGSSGGVVWQHRPLVRAIKHSAKLPECVPAWRASQRVCVCVSSLRQAAIRQQSMETHSRTHRGTAPPGPATHFDACVCMRIKIAYAQTSRYTYTILYI